MKILVVSDSHGNLENLIKMYEDVLPQIVICTGDVTKDIDELSYIFPDRKYYIVRGNCDMFDRKYDIDLEFDICGKKFFITHGHKYGVKYDLSKLEKISKNYDFTIFGHTHIPYKNLDKTSTIFNPGSAGMGSFGVIEIQGDTVKCYHKHL